MNSSAFSVTFRKSKRSEIGVRYHCLEMNDGHTDAVFVCISLDEHPAIGRGLEQHFIDRLQPLFPPQLTVVARLLVGRDHGFVQSEYSVIPFYPLLQNLSENAWSADRPASDKACTYTNARGNDTPCH